MGDKRKPHQRPWQEVGASDDSESEEDQDQDAISEGGSLASVDVLSGMQ